MIPDNHYDRNEALIERALIEINAQTEALIRGLTIDGAGNIQSTAANLQRVKAMQKEIMKALTQGEFKTAMEKVVSGYGKVPEYVTEAFKAVDISPVFSTADEDMIRIMQNDTLNEAAALSAQWGGQINSAIYVGAVAGTSRKDLIEQTRQLLIGHTDAAGRPMSSHARTLVNTRIAELDTLLLLRKGDEFKIKRWRYVGSLIKDSRAWCARHAGKVFTTKEVEAWRPIQWQGKKAGDPFVVRGGWNCRHGWSPVVE